jgi:hypothetical protein
MLFASAELEEAWAQVGDPNNAHYPNAVRQLIENRDQLPAPFVVYTQSIGMLCDSHLRSLEEASVLLCRCGAQRCVLPLRGGAHLDPAGESIRLQAGQLLEITFWGGDQRSTVIRLSLPSQGLFVERIPFVEGLDLSFFDFLEPLDDQLMPLHTLNAIVEGVYPFAEIPFSAPGLGALSAFTITDVQDGAITLQLHPGVMQPRKGPLHQCA